MQLFFFFSQAVEEALRKDRDCPVEKETPKMAFFRGSSRVRRRALSKEKQAEKKERDGKKKSEKTAGETQQTIRHKHSFSQVP